MNYAVGSIAIHALITINQIKRSLATTYFGGQMILGNRSRCITPAVRITNVVFCTVVPVWGMLVLK